MDMGDVIAVIALIISILAYQRTGGTAELKRKMESAISPEDMKKQMDSLMTITNSLREKTAEAIEKLENTLRGLDKRRRRSPSKDAPSQPEREKTDEQS